MLCIVNFFLTDHLILLNNFLGVFAKLQKAIISFVMSVRLSVLQSVHMGQLGSYGWIFMKFGI
jgi:hypothetical protein